jgi:UDP-N-acetylglucosamine 2-epimerase
MAPVIRELDRRNIQYNFIDAGQHGGITPDLLRQFELRVPDVYLRRQLVNISSINQAIAWLVLRMYEIVLNKNYVFENVFMGHTGICLIHGDTLTTLISLIYAKRCGLKVAHIEAGLRSFDLLNPFPEEIIRIIAMHFADILFAPSSWALENLINMGYVEKSLLSNGNTIIDAIKFVKDNTKSKIVPSEPYVLVTTHRVETIYSKKRLLFLKNLLLRIAHEYRVLFVMHEPTNQQLSSYGFLEMISNEPNISILPLQPYLSFINLIDGADCVITDGGSIQEECYYLGVPCLILRIKTERREGIGKNAHIASFDKSEVEKFLANLPTTSRKTIIKNKHPSKTIVDYLTKYI